MKSYKPALICVLFLAFLGSCKQAEPTKPAANDADKRKSKLTLLYDSPGGPRQVAFFDAGKVPETLDPKYSNLTPGFVEIEGISIHQQERLLRGVELRFTSVTYPENKNPPNHSTADLDEDEVTGFLAAVDQEMSYIEQAKKSPPQNEERLEWVSVEGIVLSSALSKGEVSYTIAKRPGVALAITPEHLAQLKQQMQAAMNMTAPKK